MKKCKLLLCFIAFLSMTTLTAQKSISGTVVDDFGEGIIGASILEKGTTNGTVTDLDGQFSLEVSADATDLLITYTGYQEQTVALGNATVLEIVLREGLILDEIVVSGQGSGIQRKRLSTQVDVITEEQIDKLPANQIDQLLQSNAPGAQVRLSSGQPGTAAIIRTRGPISAASSATPIVIVDGIRVDNLNSNPELGLDTGGADISALADIPVESIEKIEYIKGGAATTLYGADAANGVIQIITKKGKSGEPRAFIETRVGAINGEDKWLKYQRTAEAIFEPGLLTEFKAGISGGTAQFSYNVVGSLYQDDGFNDLNEQRKRAFNFGLTSNLSKKLTYQGSFSYTGFDYNFDYNANTSFSRFSALEGGAFGDVDALEATEWEELKEDIRNRGSLTNITNRVNRLTASNKLSYAILDNLDANFTLGIDARNTRQQEIASNAFQIAVGAIAEGTTDQAVLNRNIRNAFTTTADLNFAHNIDVGKLSFITIAGGRFFRTNDYQEALNASQGVDGTSSVNNFAEKTGADFALENANYGIYFLENIGFNDVLFLELGGTFDKNTSAGRDVGFQFLPKVGITYNLSEQDFYRDSPISAVMNNVRFRANYGEATNFAQPFSQDRTFALESFLGTPAFRFANPGNTELRSERVKTYEYGVDLGFFDYRLNLGATYYDGTTTDALFTPNNIPSSGQLAQITNIGEIKNTGWEFELRANVINTAKHKLNINASYNVNDNVVASSGGAPPFIVGGFTVIGAWIEEGQSLGFLRGTQAILTDDGTYEFIPDSFLGKSFAPKFGSLGLNYTFDKFSFYATADYQSGGSSVELSQLLRFLRGVEVEQIPEEIRSQPFFNIVNLFVYDSDFFKVRNIGAAYDVGGLADGRIRNIRLGLNLTNPFNWTSGNFDPETTGSGIGTQNGFASGGFAYGTESPPRTIVGSIKFQF